MRKILSSLGLVVILLPLLGTSGCQTYTEPGVDEVKGVRILEQPDPRTLEIFGHVTAQRTFARSDWRRAEELTLERLKAAAMREYPETTVLFHVELQPGDGHNTLKATGIAARRRGS